MFYIKEFFYLFLKRPVLFGIYLLLMGMFINFSPIKSHWEKVLPQKQVKAESDYFYALIDSRQNYQRIARKVNELPGVENVEVIGREELAMKSGKFIGGLGPEFVEEMNELNMASVKVIFSSGLNMKSKNLIRDYIEKLSGRDGAILGPLKKGNTQSLDLKLATDLVLNNLFICLVGLLFIFWLVLFFVLKSDFSKRSYIIEKFQRKRHVSFKILLAGHICVIIPSLLISLVLADFGPLEFVFLLVILGLNLLSFKRNKWAN